MTKVKSLIQTLLLQDTRVLALNDDRYYGIRIKPVCHFTGILEAPIPVQSIPI